MAITTSGEKIYLCKQNDDLKLTMEGFTLPTHDAGNSYLGFEFELVYDSGEPIFYDGLQVSINLHDATIDGTTITAMCNLPELSAITENQQSSGLLDGFDGKNQNTSLMWYGNNYNGAWNDWEYDGWQKALRIEEERFGFLGGESVLSLSLRDSSNNEVDTWQIWDTGSSSFDPDILNGPNGSSITEDSNFLYTNISNCSSSAGAIGDPHITTFQGDKYTL